MGTGNRGCGWEIIVRVGNHAHHCPSSSVDSRGPLAALTHERTVLKIPGFSSPGWNKPRRDRILLSSASHSPAAGEDQPERKLLEEKPLFQREENTRISINAGETGPWAGGAGEGPVRPARPSRVPTLGMPRGRLGTAGLLPPHQEIRLNLLRFQPSL